MPSFADLFFCGVGKGKPPKLSNLVVFRGPGLENKHDEGSVVMPFQGPWRLH